MSVLAYPRVWTIRVVHSGSRVKNVSALEPRGFSRFSSRRWERA